METMLHQENVFLNVLIIEDSAEYVELIVLELRRAGYSPRWRRVDSASQLSSALNDGTWHVILCDYTMSNFTAGEALRIVQAKGVKAPFIIVSATILDESALELMRSGARDIVMKSSLTRIEGAVRRELSDLASRKDAERAASASRQELVTMLESIGDAFSKTVMISVRK